MWNASSHSRQLAAVMSPTVMSTLARHFCVAVERGRRQRDHAGRAHVGGRRGAVQIDIQRARADL
jgi:hypothetical protein